MAGSLRILIADDELDIRDYFVRVLPQLGYEVVGAAQDGVELVNLCEELKPDLVLTDVRMPEMDGIAAAEHINEARPTPVILVSAYQDPDVFEKISDGYIMAYLVKPVKHTDLGAAIELAAKRFSEMHSSRNKG